MQVSSVFSSGVLCAASRTHRRGSGAAGRVLVVAAVFALLFGLFPSVVTADGITWTAQTSAADNYWNSVTYGGPTGQELFVAVASTGTGNRVMTSPDGITWTAQTSAADYYWNSVTYGNGLFVAVGSSWPAASTPFMTSPDGINWTARGADPSWSSINRGNWVSVTYGGPTGQEQFVAVANSGIPGNAVITSPDGITWTAQASANDNQWTSVTYGNGLFVAVSSAGQGHFVMTSPNGVTWSAQTAAVNTTWRSVTYGNGLFVAVATFPGNVMTSPDGITWTSRTPAAQATWTSVTYGGPNGQELFVAVSAAAVMTSPDGITWTSRTPPAIIGWNSVAYGSGLFAAVAMSGSGNRVMTSGAVVAPPTASPSQPESDAAAVALPLTTMPVPATVVAPSTTATTVAPTTAAPTTAAPTTTVPAPVTGIDGALPDPEIGEGLVFEGGEPVPTELTVADDTLTLSGNAFEISLTPDCATTCDTLQGPDGDVTIVAESGNNAQLSGFGFKPGTQVDVWLFSEATYLGSLTVQADGTFAGDVPIPYLPAGEHTLQTNGMTVDDRVRSANAAIGVASETAPTPSDGQLPSTGTESTTTLVVVMLLLAAGLAAMITATRRPEPQ